MKLQQRIDLSASLTYLRILDIYTVSWS